MIRPEVVLVLLGAAVASAQDPMGRIWVTPDDPRPPPPASAPEIPPTPSATCSAT